MFIGYPMFRWLVYVCMMIDLLFYVIDKHVKVMFIMMKLCVQN